MVELADTLDSGFRAKALGVRVPLWVFFSLNRFFC